MELFGAGECGENAVRDFTNQVGGFAMDGGAMRSAKEMARTEHPGHYVGLMEPSGPPQGILDRPQPQHMRLDMGSGINREVEDMARGFQQEEMAQQFHEQEMRMQHEHRMATQGMFEGVFHGGPQEWAEEFQDNHQNWAEEFHQQQTFDQEVQQQRGGGFNAAVLERFKNHENPKFRNSKFVKFVDRINKGELQLDEEKNEVVELAPEQYTDMHGGEWAEEFNTEQGEHKWALEFEQQHQNGLFGQSETVRDWVNEFENTDWSSYMNSGLDWGEEFANQAAGPASAYVFAESNSYLGNAEAFHIGTDLMSRGYLSEAILAFEAAVQMDPSAEAWKCLGQCQQENENDLQAIHALEQSVELDVYGLDALLMLGVSHTNDLERGQALQYLRRWIEHHPDFHVLTSQYAGPSPAGSFDEVSSLFLGAREMSGPFGGDADIETVLGVLYNISNEYDKAIHSFQNATRLVTDDPSLWNKLGATLANGGRSEEAIEAYTRALGIKPNYVRALANLGISFANQGKHQEAVQAYLATLQQNPDAAHVWNYLRISLSSLGRTDLCDLAGLRDVEAFRDFFDF